jgi:hypothetical protein
MDWLARLTSITWAPRLMDSAWKDSFSGYRLGRRSCSTQRKYGPAAVDERANHRQSDQREDDEDGWLRYRLLALLIWYRCGKREAWARWLWLETRPHPPGAVHSRPPGMETSSSALGSGNIRADRMEPDAATCSGPVGLAAAR